MSEEPSVIKAGDNVRIVEIPNWLVHDLPKTDVEAIYKLVGRSAIVAEVDSSGYIWFGSGEAVQLEDGSWHGDPTFCLTSACVAKIPEH